MWSSLQGCVVDSILEKEAVSGVRQLPYTNYEIKLEQTTTEYSTFVTFVVRSSGRAPE